MIKNVFFDLDGTIIDSSEGVYEGIKLALTSFDYEIPHESVLRKCIGPPFSYSFPKYFGVKDDEFPKMLKIYRDFYENGGLMKCKVYDGIVDLLEALVKRGYTLNICSSKPGETCKDLLEQLHIAHYFNDIVGATKDGKVDTKEQVIELCFERSPEKRKDETILIGDTKYDAEGAKSTGTRCIGISWGFGTEEEMMNSGALAVFDDWKEVLEYIEENKN